MRVHLSSHLQHYTANAAEVQAKGGTLDAVLKDLDRQFPGLRFRIIDEQGNIRPHMNIFVNSGKVRALDGVALGKDDVLHLLASISGG